MNGMGNSLETCKETFLWGIRKSKSSLTLFLLNRSSLPVWIMGGVDWSYFFAVLPTHGSWMVRVIEWRMK